MFCKCFFSSLSWSGLYNVDTVIVYYFTVVCSVIWALNDSEGGGNFVLIQTSPLLFLNQVVLMLTSLHLNQKRRDMCIKAGYYSASFAFIGKVTENTTIKWSMIWALLPTCKASIELCSHGDVSIPVPRHDTDVPCFDIWHQWVWFHRILISVSWEILLKTNKNTQDETNGAFPNANSHVFSISNVAVWFPFFQSQRKKGSLSIQSVLKVIQTKFDKICKSRRFSSKMNKISFRTEIRRSFFKN